MAVDLRELENVNPWEHWYYLAKAEAILRLLPSDKTIFREVTDVGAGSTFFSQYLSKYMPGAEFICVDPNYSSSSQKFSSNITMLQQFDSRHSDLLLFMDVLEHVEDDLALVLDYIENAKVGAQVVITVPAFMSLWSSHDVYLGHFRRYRRSELEKVVASAGLKIQSSHYLFSSLLPVVYLLRRLGYRKNSGSNMTELPRSINAILLRIHQFENRFIRNSLFGLSVVLVANKV
jgi:2-polyprenyl-3-methyl-5-hydroxy-6-metoxy-1,4-benzoquinol methylase